MNKGERMSLSLDLKMVIYVITHVASSRKYVGQTVKKAKIRKREHLNAAGGVLDQSYTKNMYIVRALRKDGADAFTFEVIEQCSSRAELDEREAFWIKELNTLSPNGFNLKSGATGVDGVVIAPEVKQRISKANKGRVKGPEWRAALSRSHMGKVLTPEWRANVGKAQLGKKRGPRTVAVKAKIAAALKDRPLSEERKTAVREGMARMTVEAKALMRQRYSQSRTGRKQGPHSEIHRLSIAIGHLKRSEQSSKSLETRVRAAETRAILERQSAELINSSI